MKIENFSKGRKGEDIAAKFLEEKGFTVLERNWHTRFGELDVIAIKDDVIVFVEVKLKVGDLFGTPEEMINKRKMFQVLNTAEMYLLKDPKLKALKRRIDAVCIVANKEGDVIRINHYEAIT